MTTVAFPDVEVRLSEEDGNVFNVIGVVARALRQGGHSDAATAFTADAMASSTYDEVLALVARMVVID